MGECGSRGDWRVWEQEKREVVGAGEMGGCKNRGDERVWKQRRWEGFGVG